MSFDFNKFQIFQRYTKVLNKSELLTHLYLPWTEEIDLELMFKVKKQLRSTGVCYIPLLELSGDSANINDDQFANLKNQLKLNYFETHLVMNNQKVVHILKVDDILATNNLDEKISNEFQIPNASVANFWVKVSDLYVLDVDYLGVKDDINNKLVRFMQEEQQRVLFQKWIKTDRQLTYDYFMRSCELEESIYPMCWQGISSKSKHLLIHGETLRKEAVSLRDSQKWKALQEAFESYKNAVMWELNETYVFPLIDSLLRYENCLKEWRSFASSQIEKDSTLKLIEELLSKKTDSIDNFNCFLTFVKDLKSHLFSFKREFTNKLFSEEFLILEKCLEKHEQRIEAFKYQGLCEKVDMLSQLELWVGQVKKDLIRLEPMALKNCTLKLGHILSLINTSSQDNNIFFSLLEIKLERSCSCLDLNDEVKALFEAPKLKVS